MLYRESIYNEDCEDPSLTEVFLRKNRHGPTGRIELRFDASRMSFRT
jgi:replicative DNA helicase